FQGAGGHVPSEKSLYPLRNAIFFDHACASSLLPRFFPRSPRRQGFAAPRLRRDLDCCGLRGISPATEGRIARVRTSLLMDSPHRKAASLAETVLQNGHQTAAPSALLRSPHRNSVAGLLMASGGIE